MDEVKIADIEKEICKIQELVIGLRQNRENVWTDVNRELSKIVAPITEFVEYIQAENKEEIPVLVVLQQIQNLNEAYSAKDAVMLADVLEYEISNALYVYIEEKRRQDNVSGQ